jgi:membrane fusion protein, multidrug efflux system
MKVSAQQSSFLAPCGYRAGQAFVGKKGTGKKMTGKITSSYLLMFITLTAFMHACSPSPKKQPAADKAVPVETAVAVQKSVPVQMSAVGYVEAFQTISVRSQITAQIKKVLFKEGQEVKAGDLLFELDCRTNDAALNQAEANLRKDKAQADYAAEQLRRYTELLKEEYVTRGQYEQMQANAIALQATLKADEAVVESNRVQMQFCSINSPVDGRAGTIKVHQGNIIKANDTELLTINQIQPVNVGFAIPEKDLSKIRTYFDQKKLEVDAFIPDQGRPEKGDLAFIDNAVNTATGTITMKGTFANRDKRLVPGQFVNVVLQLGSEPSAILVPSQSVEQGQKDQHVYVVKPDSTVEMRSVVAGQEIDGETVILKGIQAGERVVKDGQMRLTPGAKVTIKNQDDKQTVTQ